nr:transmembrane protein, putative [Ipomoea batatas]
MIGYVTKVRLTSFFAGAATASFAGIYLLHQDYKACHDSIAQENSISVFQWLTGN